MLGDHCRSSTKMLPRFLRVLMTEIAECPHCLVTVLPTSIDLCPSCNKRFSEPQTVIRERISPTEESKLIQSAVNMHRGLKFLYIGIGVLCFNVLYSFVGKQARPDWAGLVLLTCLVLSIPYTNYRMKKTLARLAKTTSR